MRKLALLVLVTAMACWGQDIDPATLHIGTGHGTPGAHGLGSHPNIIGTTVLSIYQNTNGAPPLSNGLVLILGVAVIGGGGFPSAPSLGVAPVYYAGDAGSGAAATATLIARGLLGVGYNGGYGSLDSTHTQAYDNAKFDSVADNSESWTNWSPLVPGVSYFALFAYKIEGFNLSGHDLVDVFFTGLPAGTFAIAYGCDNHTTTGKGKDKVDVPGPAGDALDGACSGGIANTYATAITQAGFTSVPEPATITLTGAGLLGLLLGWRKRKASPSLA